MKPDIYWIKGPWSGRLAVLARPRGNDWLADEIAGWQTSGVEVVVSLLTDEENAELGLSDEADVAQRNGLTFISYPINDYSVPSSREATFQLVRKLEDLLSRGGSIGIHCRQGIGRSSLIAACVLATSGKSVEEGFERIGNARGLTVPDTREQRDWVGDFANQLLTNIAS